MRIPAECKDGDSVRQKLNEIVRYLRYRDAQLPRTTKRTKFVGNGASPPFDVILKTTVSGETTTYSVKVRPGYVIERVPGPDDAIEYHEPANLWDDTDPTKLAEFEIVDGQAVYIKVQVDENGTVTATSGDAVAIEVAADDQTSDHYEPKVDDESSDGVAGTMKYKLAVFTAGPPAKLEKFAAGSHISHWQDLPQMKCDGGGVSPIKKWDNAAKCYKYRGTKGLFGIKEQDGGDDINLDLDIENVGSGQQILKTDNGEGDDAKAQLRTIRGAATGDPGFSGAQIEVSTPGGGNDILVRGNQVDGSFQLKDCNGVTLLDLQWIDGLITNPSSRVGAITVGECSSSGGGE